MSDPSVLFYLYELIIVVWGAAGWWLLLREVQD